MIFGPDALGRAVVGSCGPLGRHLLSAADA